MAKRRGTKLERHMAHLRDTGQLTEWLQRRMEWDTDTTDRILARMWETPRDAYMRELNKLMKSYYNPVINRQFYKSATLCKE